MSFNSHKNSLWWTEQEVPHLIADDLRWWWPPQGHWLKAELRVMDWKSAQRAQMGCLLPSSHTASVFLHQRPKSLSCWSWHFLLIHIDYNFTPNLKHTLQSCFSNLANMSGEVRGEAKKRESFLFSHSHFSMNWLNLLGLSHSTSVPLSTLET